MRRRSIYSPLGIRVLGLVKILDGFFMVLYGHRARSPHMAFVRWGAKRRGQQRLRLVR